jgi:hypothetical protein
MQLAAVQQVGKNKPMTTCNTQELSFRLLNITISSLVLIRSHLSFCRKTTRDQPEQKVVQIHKNNKQSLGLALTL